MASAPIKQTLESIVTRYRREANLTELEVRLQDVDFDNFSEIYNALLNKKNDNGILSFIGDGKLTQMISAIVEDRTLSRGDGPHRYLRPMKIREIFFDNGRRVREQFVKKEPLLIPFRVTSYGGISYIVALSTEQLYDQKFSVDEGGIIRIKARVSFEIRLKESPDLQWRIDMTITRQIMGSDAESSLKQIIAQMFATTPHMTPESFLKALQVDTNVSYRNLYRYEVEAEVISDSAIRDNIRPSNITAVANAILHLANPKYLHEAAMQAEIYKVAHYIIKAPGFLIRFQHEFGLKRLLPQALAITRADYRGIYPPLGMFLTEKADGKRAIAIVGGGKGAIIADIFLDGYGLKTITKDTILDGELVTGDDGKYSFYAFDVIVVNGEDVSQKGFEKRIEYIDVAVAIMREAGLPVSAKKYIHISSDQPIELAREISAVYDAKHSYKTDGLIFVEPGKPYNDTASYKWKPVEHNTIDMFAHRAPKSVLGKKPFIDQPGHKLYFLFVGINSDLYDALGLQRCPGYTDIFGTNARNSSESVNYFPIQFSPSDAPLAYMYQHPDTSKIPSNEIDGSIIEVRCAGDCSAAGSGSSLVDWEIVRIRGDRRRELATKFYFGNDFHTAELIWLNYLDPFPLEQLWEGSAPDYFMRSKAGIYRAQTGVISFIKSQRIAKLKHANWVVDIGIGKGQDLGRYLDAEVKHLVAIDRDRAALSELVRRKYSFAKRDNPRDKHSRNKKIHSSTTIHILAADANDNFNVTLSKLESLELINQTGDALVCNLAIHYFMTNIVSMRNFIALAKGILKIGGQVILTILIGEEVHEILSKTNEGESWDVFETIETGAPPIKKYSIKRLYSSNTLEAAGQRIGVFLPFSDGNYYEEYLVNTKVLISEFSSRGFSVVDFTNATKRIPEYEVHNHTLTLTDGDRKWISLYGELVFQRNK